ncbi:MAG TPA: hypothetical protein VHC95_07455 [Opitutales bacterium]|nr:hypothetical protein [Opitutales bacterium]
MKPNRALFSRLSHYGATAALAATASTARGSVVFFDNTHAFTVTPPVTTGLNTHVWDIDGNSVNDFQFLGQKTSYGGLNVHVARILSHGGDHFVVANTTVNHGYTNTMKPLPLGFTIKAAGMASGAKFQAGSSLINMTLSGIPAAPLHTGRQYVGFEFLISGFTHYGWADIDVGLHFVTIRDWAYESVAGASIMVPVPEPANAPVGLGLLALGAAGISAYKRRRKLAA